MPTDPLFIGLDLGTSGARAVIIDARHSIRATGKSAMSEHGPNFRDPAIWWRAAQTALHAALAQIDPSQVAALAVDGTSGTMLPVDANATPLAMGAMYNDPCTDESILAAIAQTAPATSAAHGPTSGLAKALVFQRLNPAMVLHQADWIAAQFSGRLTSDENNALKTGYDPVLGAWPDYIATLGLEPALLPAVLPPGTVIGPITTAAAAQFGLSATTQIVAGTTDGCASFLATGASGAGQGVSALGTTLTLKILSDHPIFAPEYGIYSHRILGKWLAGGASNTGGTVLLAHFTADEIAALTPQIDPETDTGLNYYPLPKPGERFPIADPTLAPRLIPRPDNPSTFLHGIFEGIAEIEALGYARLAQLGAPPLQSVRSVGGGARNPKWSRIRARKLGVPLLEPQSDEAAFGTALLAQQGIK